MIQGSLDRLHLGDLLQWFQMGGLTGRLTLVESHRRRHLDLLDGEVVYASSTVPEERLATWLAAEGVLPATLLRRLLAVSLLRRTLFTELLIEQGGFSPDHLRSSLARLAETITSRVLTAREVRFELDPGYPVQRFLGMTLNVEPNTLIMEAARRSDERSHLEHPLPDVELPFEGAAFDTFFWELIQEGIPDQERVDGEEVVRLQRLLHNIMETLARWLDSGPGLVPLPPGQASRIWQHNRAGERIDLHGLPHASWNQMVLACAIRTSHPPQPETLLDLIEASTELDVWEEMAATDLWRRPQAGQIDTLTARSVAEWSARARAAAAHLGVAPDTARLATHLAVVPTDLVLWVVATLPISHRRLRATLLRELPRRIGLGLSHLADFPELFRELFSKTAVTPLGVCLHLARQALPTAQVWPATVPEDDSILFGAEAPERLSRAAAAAREAFPTSTEGSAAAV